MNTKVNPFDFTDTSDLPEELAGKLSKGGSTAFLELVGVIKAAADVGIKALTMNEIMAAAIRMGIELPADVTVRNWLNKAINKGHLCKPTRQTYALPGTVAEDEGDEGEEEAPVEAPVADVVADADPLGDL